MPAIRTQPERASKTQENRQRWIHRRHEVGFTVSTCSTRVKAAERSKPADEALDLTKTAEALENLEQRTPETHEPRPTLSTLPTQPKDSKQTEPIDEGQILTVIDPTRDVRANFPTPTPTGDFNDEYLAKLRSLPLPATWAGVPRAPGPTDPPRT